MHNTAFKPALLYKKALGLQQKYWPI